ncbi:MAG: hypothetical protein ACOC4E_00375 [Patescibacteria group bacterium]
MADRSQNQSFIPKAIPTKKRPQKPTRRIYLFTVISYVAMFSALLASGSVFLYQNYMQTLLDAEIRGLTAEINDFNEARMIEVLEFDERLSAADRLMSNSFSVVSVLSALEAATAGSVQLESLTLEQVGEDTLQLSASVVADTFDSTIFQRRFYEASDVIGGVEVSDVALVVPDSEEGGEGEASALSAASDERQVTFELALTVPRSAVGVQATSQTAEPVAERNDSEVDTAVATTSLEQGTTSEMTPNLESSETSATGTEPNNNDV